MFLSKMCIKTIKNIIVLLIFAVTALQSQDYPGGYNPAAEKNQGKAKKISPFFFLDLKFPKVQGNWSTELGGGAGVLFNGTFGLAAEYFSLLSDNIRVQVDDKGDFALGLGYGGLSGAYTFSPLNIMMLSVGVFGGLGRVTNSYQNVLGVSNYSVDDWFFIAEPRFKLGFRIIKGLWIGATVAYRMPMGLKYYDIGNDDLTGLCLSVGFFTF